MRPLRSLLCSTHQLPEELQLFWGGLALAKGMLFVNRHQQTSWGGGGQDCGWPFRGVGVGTLDHIYVYNYLKANSMSTSYHLTSCQGTTCVRRRDTYLLRREKRKPACWTPGCPKVWNQLPINNYIDILTYLWCVLGKWKTTLADVLWVIFCTQIINSTDICGRKFDIISWHVGADILSLKQAWKQRKIALCFITLHYHGHFN